MTKITIFSGFLGAGKTTLIKKLIPTAYKGEKLVLIENEFGEIGIDGGFMKDAGIEAVSYTHLTLFDPVETWKKRTFTNVRAERLNRPIYVNGKRVYENPPLRDIRDFCAAQVATLWDEVTRFENPHRYYVDLSQKLWDERQRLLTEFGR